MELSATLLEVHKVDARNARHAAGWRGVQPSSNGGEADEEQRQHGRCGGCHGAAEACAQTLAESSSI